MKKRIVKKLIKRDIQPLIANLPVVNHFDRERYDNYTIINGEVIPEGNVITHEYNVKRAIKKQVVGIKKLLAYADREILVRIGPEALIRLNEDWYNRRNNPKMKFYGVYTRLLVSKREEVTT